MKQPLNVVMRLRMDTHMPIFSQKGSNLKGVINPRSEYNRSRGFAGVWNQVSWVLVCCCTHSTTWALFITKQDKENCSKVWIAAFFILATAEYTGDSRMLAAKQSSKYCQLCLAHLSCCLFSFCFWLLFSCQHFGLADQFLFGSS